MSAFKSASATIQSLIDRLNSDNELAQDPRLVAMYDKFTAFVSEFTDTVSTVVKERTSVPTDFTKEVYDALAFYGLKIEDVIGQKFTSDIGAVTIRGIYREIENPRGESTEELIGHQIGYSSGNTSGVLINTSAVAAPAALDPLHVDRARGLLLSLFHKAAMQKYDTFTPTVQVLQESQCLALILTGHLLVYTDINGEVVHRSKADKVRVYTVNARGNEKSDRCILALSTGLFVLRDNLGAFYAPDDKFSDQTYTVVSKAIGNYVQCIGEARVPPFLKR